MFVGSMEEEGWKTQKRTKCELAWDILELGMFKWDKI